MTTIKDAATEFLGHKRIAVTGVSRKPGEPPERRLPTPARPGLLGVRGHPNADEVEGDVCCHDLKSIRKSVV